MLDRQLAHLSEAPIPEHKIDIRDISTCSKVNQDACSSAKMLLKCADGAGWQGMAAVAAKLGYAPESFGFAALTGIGGGAWIFARNALIGFEVNGDDAKKYY